MAFNEEANIAKSIESVLAQRVSRGTIAEVMVVSSGSTDRTNAIVEEYAAADPRIRLIVQERRMGKASAINVFVGAAMSPILVMSGADVMLREGTIDALLRHFDDPTVGMVGAHPIPVNDETTFLGHTVHLLWRLHDRLARVAPKLGEVVAFRNVVPSIPADTAVDEISIQALITQMGFRLAYEPEAVIYNHGPATVGDFLRQRRRIYAGHLKVQRQQGYEASTMSVRRIATVMSGSGAFASPRAASWTVGAIALEAAARGLGHYDYIRHRSHHVWDTAVTTKRPVAPAARPQAAQSVLVFNIVNFHRVELEHGLRASRQLVQRVSRQIQFGLGPHAVVFAQRAGTIVVLLPVDREAAEHAAHVIVSAMDGERYHIAGGQALTLRVACGIIAFSASGQALAESIPVSLPSEIQPVLAG